MPRHELDGAWQSFALPACGWMQRLVHHCCAVIVDVLAVARGSFVGECAAAQRTKLNTTPNKLRKVNAPRPQPQVTGEALPGAHCGHG